MPENKPNSDNRSFIKRLGPIGPLTYLSQDEPAIPEQSEPYNPNISALGNTSMVMAAGIRGMRGMGITCGFIFSPFIIILANYSLHTDFIGDWAITAILTLAVTAMISWDLWKTTESITIFDRNRQIVITPDLTHKLTQRIPPKFNSWQWNECCVAIERVFTTTQGGQHFNLRVVKRDANGNPVQTILLARWLSDINSACVIYESIRRYMSNDDTGLPKEINPMPYRKLCIFQSFKHRFVTSHIRLDNNGLPKWPRSLVVLFYIGLAAFTIIAFPFVSGTLLSELSSRELDFQPELIPALGAPLPNTKVLPAQETLLTRWEKPYIIITLIGGLTAWIFLADYVPSLFA